MPWISNHKYKIEEKSTKSSRASSKVVGLHKFPMLRGIFKGVLLPPIITMDDSIPVDESGFCVGFNKADGVCNVITRPDLYMYSQHVFRFLINTLTNTNGGHCKEMNGRKHV